MPLASASLTIASVLVLKQHPARGLSNLAGLAHGVPWIYNLEGSSVLIVEFELALHRQLVIYFRLSTWLDWINSCSAIQALCSCFERRHWTLLYRDYLIEQQATPLVSSFANTNSCTILVPFTSLGSKNLLSRKYFVSAKAWQQHNLHRDNIRLIQSVYLTLGEPGKAHKGKGIWVNIPRSKCPTAGTKKAVC